MLHSLAWSVLTFHVVLAYGIADSVQPLEIDTSQVGQTFYGIGGLSGGGATSVLLKDYVEPQKSEILDYLFKPQFGASLQILKVEIGGDSQSTDGTESSHMHSPDDLDYHRGYEWWLLSEAKKRNPEIKTYGLPWAYPGWVGGPEGSGDPFKHPEITSKYILKWLEGARDVYDLDIDYIGIWNERSSSATYVKTLRKTLDAAGFAKTKLVAKDGDASICNDMAKDKDYAAAVEVVGLHYPSDFANYSTCREIGFGLDGKRNGKPIWASEESSSFDDLNGAACWARIITSHWVLQGMTSSIMWNLVGSYFHGTNWDASSMLTAQEPWSGNYHALEVVWATAHVTQFTEVGWDLLKVGHGSGELPKGGFYATYADPKSESWTLTVVKIDEDHAPCTRPPLPHFDVYAENVTFKLAKSMAAKELAVWYSNFEDFNPDGTVSSIFQRLANIAVKDGEFTLQVKVGAFYTVTTIMDGPAKGQPAGPIPRSEPSMPLPFYDDFQTYNISQEGKWWSDQIGVFEVHYEHGSTGNKVMKQMVPELPIGWSDPGTNGPMSLVGMREWQDINISASFQLPGGVNGSACLGSRVDQMWSAGIVLCISPKGHFTLSVGGPKLGGIPHGQIYKSGNVAALPAGVWTTMSLTTVGSFADATLNGAELFAQTPIRNLDTGFAAIGATDWFPLMFDNVQIQSAGTHWAPSKSSCPDAKVGDVLHVRSCVANGLAASDQVFELLADWGIRHLASGLCASATSSSDGSLLTLAECNPQDLLQQFKNDYTTIRNVVMPLFLKAGTGKSMLSGDVNGDVYVAKNGQEGKHGAWQKWAYFPNTKQLRNQYIADVSLGYPMCLSTCRGPSGEAAVHYV